ncbi:hypothetical protein AHAS_Ahas02G0137200 [Arachis hypogaea]
MMFLLLVWNLSLWMQQSNFTTPMQEVLCLTRGIEVRKRIQMELCTTLCLLATKSAELSPKLVKRRRPIQKDLQDAKSG